MAKKDDHPQSRRWRAINSSFGGDRLFVGGIDNGYWQDQLNRSERQAENHKRALDFSEKWSRTTKEH